MFVLSHLITASAEVLDWIFAFLEIVIFIRVLLSWANADPYNQLVRMVHAVTEPLLAPLRRLWPPWRLNGLDLSPIFAFLALLFARRFLIGTLMEIAARLR